MRTRLLALPLAVAAVMAAAVPANAAPPSDRTLVVGSFNGPAVQGKSYFRPDGAGQTWVVSSLRGLTPGKAFFTVVYGNDRCDPAAAFPAGPVYADRYGRATLVTTIATGDADLRSSGSVSMRMADEGNDIDQDRIFGPIDVVAVVGSPSIGLVACDTKAKVR